MKVDRLIVRAHAPNLDASVAFYEKLRFSVREDAAVGVPLIARASHPWGVWLIVKDPAGNAVSLTTWDFY